MFAKLAYMIMVTVMSIIYFPTIQSSEKSNILLTTMHFAADVMTYLLILAGIIEVFYATRNLKNFYLNVNRIYIIFLQEFSICIDYQKIKRSNIMRMSICSIVFLSLLTMTVFTKKLDFLHSAVFTLQYCVGMFLVLCNFLFIIFLVDIVNMFLQNLLLTLESMIEIDHGTVILCFEEKSYSICSFEKVLGARRIYNLIFHCGDLINSSLGLSLLLYVLAIVINETLHGFKVFMLIIDSFETNLLIGKMINDFIYKIGGEFNIHDTFTFRKLVARYYQFDSNDGYLFLLQQN